MFDNIVTLYLMCKRFIN